MRCAISRFRLAFRFYVRTISYLMDLYRGHYEAEKIRSIWHCICPFKISVGPIARYRDFAPQLTSRQETVEKTAEEFGALPMDLVKSVVANIVGASVDKICAGHYKCYGRYGVVRGDSVCDSDLL
ncbi:MAG: hypothetical protein ACLURV_05325 [Gallintestinimicrobium sp.]